MKILVKLLLIIFASAVLYSQSPPCMEDYHGLSFKQEDIVSNPPLSIYMPYDVIISYLVLDSLSANMPIADFRELLDRQQGYTDTLQTLMKYFIVNNAYDPVRFFLFNLHDSSANILGKDVMLSELGNKLEQASADYFFDFTMLNTQMIFHIKADSIIERYDPYLGENCAIVASTITDTLFGQVAPACKDLDIPELPEDYSDPLPRILKALPGECLQFNYISSQVEDKLDWIKKDKEYIVFLSISHLCFDSADVKEVYYTLYPQYNMSKVYGMYPIVDGKVYDPENQLNLGSDCDVETFKDSLRKRINELINFDGPNAVEEFPSNNIAGDDVRVYPNPFGSETELSFNVDAPAAPVEIRIYNQLGQLVFTDNFTASATGICQRKISPEGLPSGIYYCSINTGTNVLNAKLVLMK